MFKCSWCLKHGATVRVEASGSDTEQVFRYFCNRIHQANWETNQPPPAGATATVGRDSRFEDIVRVAYMRGWRLISCVLGNDEKWHVTLQAVSPNGGTLASLSSHAEHGRLNIAMWSALLNASVSNKMPRGKPVAASLTEAQYRQLQDAMLRNMAARFEYDRQFDDGADL